MWWYSVSTMQTFVPYSNFTESAKVLDYKRLCKQVTEALQIHNVVVGKSEGWKQHPAMQQWMGYADGILKYACEMSDECERRGFKVQDKIKALKPTLKETYLLPDWLGDERVHSSHRSRLLWKGRVDAVCDRLKRYYKVRSINTWLEDKGYSIKNILSREEVYKLEELCSKLKCPPIENYYLQFKWKEDDTQGYIWPSKE